MFALDESDGASDLMNRRVPKSSRENTFAKISSDSEYNTVVGVPSNRTSSPRKK